MAIPCDIKFDLVVITGPTASGKTALAAAVAAGLGGEVISADSRQVYRKMNLGTGKDYNDYIVNGITIPFHLVDIVDPGYKYNVFEFQRDFLTIFSGLKQRGVIPVVCGGSGMYIDSIVSGYRMNEVPPDYDLREVLEKKSLKELTALLQTYKKLHNITDIDTKKRAIRAIEIEQFNLRTGGSQTDTPELKPLIAGVLFERLKRRERISERLHQRLDAGMVDEVRNLLNEGLKPEDLIYYGLEYKYITLYLIGDLTYDEMFTELETAIYRFAKRQMTWFRGMERRGIIINWVDGELPLEEKVEWVINLLISK
jgi:tRNA dimethylallyltransferase